ncbi:MAG TPA: hypothetical protein VGN88_02560 [Phycisphaerae bacterium]|jgi:hypothetical protein
MSEEQPKVNNAIQVLRGVLVVAAVLVFIGGCGMAGILASSHSPPDSDILLISFTAVVGSLVLAVLMIAASSVVGMLDVLVSRSSAAPVDDVRPALERLEESLRKLNSLQNRPEAARADGGAAATGSAWPVHLMEQVRDVGLMNEEQRKRYAQRHWSQRKKLHQECIEREVLVGDWPSVFERLEELQIITPGDPQIAELRERVESEQNSRLDEELRITRGRLRQLMGAALWQQAEELAASLQSKYPAKAEADRLVEDVRRERENWERETAERLFRDIAAATERRQWRQAILALEEFVRRYPLDARAEALRLDLPMLQENAAAHERKEQEEFFKDLLKRQHYEEAVRVARAVIGKYPQSPTATELNKLLPKVEELAKQDAARIAAQNAANLAPAAA